MAIIKLVKLNETQHEMIEATIPFCMNFIKSRGGTQKDVYIFNNFLSGQFEASNLIVESVLDNVELYQDLEDPVIRGFLHFLTGMIPMAAEHYLIGWASGKGLDETDFDIIRETINDVVSSFLKK